MGHSFRRGFLCNTYRLYLYYLEGGEIARELLRKWGCLVGDSPMFTLVIVLPGECAFHNRFYYSYQANDLFLLFQRLLSQSFVLHLRNE